MRPSKDVWALRMALLTAQRATCLRRSVGCIILNERSHVLSTGYNGVAAGLPHCNEKVLLWSKRSLNNVEDNVRYPHACSGTNSLSGTNLDGCQSIHAEQNALLQCRDVWAIDTVYVTASPCITCCKLLLNTSCKRIVFIEEYPHPQAKLLWESAGRTWLQLNVTL